MGTLIEVDGVNAGALGQAGEFREVEEGHLIWAGLRVVYPKGYAEFMAGLGKLRDLEGEVCVQADLFKVGWIELRFRESIGVLWRPERPNHGVTGVWRGEGGLRWARPYARISPRSESAVDVDPGEVVGQVVQPVGLLRVSAVHFVRVPVLATEESGKSVHRVRGTRKQRQKARAAVYARGRRVIR